MTELQNLMLSACFGAVVGAMIGELIIVIQDALEKHREKKKKAGLTETKEI